MEKDRIDDDADDDEENLDYQHDDIRCVKIFLGNYLRLIIKRMSVSVTWSVETIHFLLNLVKAVT